jgi:hypothetical protein
LAATRIIAIAIVSIAFYFLNNWAYFAIITASTISILGLLFWKLTFESPLYIMVSTGVHDQGKAILNSIAIINEEDILTEKLAFSYTPSQIQPRRTFAFLITNTLCHRQKLTVIGIMSICWLGYATAQMVHFVFLDKLQMNLYVDVLILGAAEFLAALFSKVLFKKLSRRMALVASYLFVLGCFFFLLIFTLGNNQTRYVVTISTRAAL